MPDTYGVAVIKTTLKLALCGLLGATLIGCSNGAAHGGDIEKSADTIDKSPVFETSFGRFIIKPNVVRQINAKTSPFWNYDLKRILTWEEIDQGKPVHYYAGIGSDIPYEKSGFYSYEFGHLNIFKDEFSSVHDILYRDDDGIVDITEALNKTGLDWGRLLYSHNYRKGGAELDLPYIKESYLAKYNSTHDDFTPLVGGCVLEKEHRVRCRFTGLYKDKIPFEMWAFAPITKDLLRTFDNLSVADPIIGEFPALKTAVDETHSRLEAFFTNPLESEF